LYLYFLTILSYLLPGYNFIPTVAISARLPMFSNAIQKPSLLCHFFPLGFKFFEDTNLINKQINTFMKHLKREEGGGGGRI
jgi:hypothetical protein